MNSRARRRWRRCYGPQIIRYFGMRSTSSASEDLKVSIETYNPNEHSDVPVYELSTTGSRTEERYRGYYGTAFWYSVYHSVLDEFCAAPTKKQYRLLRKALRSAIPRR